VPRPHPPEFHRRAVELARERAKPIAKIAEDLGISESCLRNWLRQANVDEGRREGLTTDERKELTQLRRENRVLRMEKEILGKAAAFLPTRATTARADPRLHRGGEGQLPDHAALSDRRGLDFGIL
jgi:transposase-like protein